MARIEDRLDSEIDWTIVIHYNNNKLINCDFQKEKVDISSFYINRRTIKEQGYIQGDINGINTVILIDTRPEVSLLTNVLFSRIKEKPALIQNDVDLSMANGTSMSVLGKATIELLLN